MMGGIMSLMGNIFNLLNKYSNDELDNAREHARKEWIKSGGKGDGAIIMKEREGTIKN